MSLVAEKWRRACDLCGAEGPHADSASQALALALDKGWIRGFMFRPAAEGLSYSRIRPIGKDSLDVCPSCQRESAEATRAIDPSTERA